MTILTRSCGSSVQQTSMMDDGQMAGARAPRMAIFTRTRGSSVQQTSTMDDRQTECCRHSARTQ
jgi:hypothetical protein